VIHRWRLLLLLQHRYANANYWPIRKLYLLTVYNPVLQLVDRNQTIKVKNPEDDSVISLFVSQSANSLIQLFWEYDKNENMLWSLATFTFNQFVCSLLIYLPIPFTKHSYLTRKDSNQSGQHSSFRVLAGYWVCHVTYLLKISSKNFVLGDQSESRILNPAL
jgi:hypothetical protein